ncbi:unnamed protein product [Adineta steineri]|uniref:Carrier domain-containing protein n=1 Tax=Adineta steineri TaxID=433720 RepID=A0A815GFJ4_9BILA|nr:unnamed protein product [Adineta steineri]
MMKFKTLTTWLYEKGSNYNLFMLEEHEYDDDNDAVLDPATVRKHQKYKTRLYVVLLAVLSDESYLMQSLNNTQTSFSSPLTCIHHEFVHQVMKHPQKLAVELDEQSLTYCELLYYVQVLSLTLLNEYHIAPGEIVIGIMGIEMVGGVYCPLSSRDPQHRLNALIEQTQSRLVLVHWLTKSKFNNKIVAFDTHLTWINNDKINDIDVDQLSNITITHNDIAYIIFTSGSTGTPKVLKVRHKNFTGNINSLVASNTFNRNDTVVQMARCSFDNHLQEILGSEPISVKLRNLIANIGISHCTVWNIYGSTELTVASTYHLVDIKSKNISIPVGKSLPNYRSFVLNKLFQTTPISQKGELFIGGIGVFAGYLGRDDLTAKALIEIDGEVFYRIGDLVTMDNNGLLHYQGRKDHQIKLHGQRIELGEIERCLLNITSISACVVMKWNDDYLVAYVQSSHINEEQLRHHCQSHLPSHMIPSIFIILEKLPLNPNGKIDRKLLPPPEFSSSTGDRDDNLPHNTLEQQLQDIFSQALHIESPHVEIPFGQLGGTSLGAIVVFTLIRQQISNKIDIGLLFTNPSIRQLAQAIEPLLVFEELQETASTVNGIHEKDVRV